jgi:hypothetical protein
VHNRYFKKSIINKDFGNVGGKWMFGNKDDGDYENRISQEIQKHAFKKQMFLAKKRIFLFVMQTYCMEDNL